MRTTVQALIDRLAGMNPDEQIIAELMTIDDVLERMGIDEQREELLYLNAHSFAGQVLDSYHNWVICRHPHTSYNDEMSELDDFQRRCDRIVEELDEAIDSAIAKGREGGAE